MNPNIIQKGELKLNCDIGILDLSIASSRTLDVCDSHC